MCERRKTGCLGNGYKRVGPCQDGLYYKLKCDCRDCLPVEAFKEEVK